jgi:hypothetical protein
MMNDDAPGGAPSRGIHDPIKKSTENILAPPCLGEALRRGALLFYFDSGKVTSVPGDFP